jgi:hypothetical protein
MDHQQTDGVHPTSNQHKYQAGDVVAENETKDPRRMAKAPGKSQILQG